MFTRRYQELRSPKINQIQKLLLKYCKGSPELLRCNSRRARRGWKLPWELATDIATGGKNRVTESSEVT
jgi:hypothetical protein